MGFEGAEKLQIFESLKDFIKLESSGEAVEPKRLQVLEDFEAGALSGFVDDKGFDGFEGEEGSQGFEFCHKLSYCYILHYALQIDS